MKGVVKAICTSRVAGEPMQEMPEALAIADQGLYGDRYATGDGSFNKGNQGNRQVTLMNAVFFGGSGFQFNESRRNLLVEGVELMWLIGREFQIGSACFRGIKYCDPCQRPSRLSGNAMRFQEVFLDRGGLIAEVIETGLIKVGDEVVPPPRGY